MPWAPEIAEVTGQFVSASNATLLAVTTDGDPVVYKPIAGERPLWDFPTDTLAAREMLTYRIAKAMQLGIVPETALGEGPYGPGSIQRYLEPDEDFDSLDLVHRADPELWPVAVLDLVCNNADRKLGHILANDGDVFAIDHGLTFHEVDKLRTVLWVFAGSALPAPMVEAVRSLLEQMSGDLGTLVASHLGTATAHALRERCHAILSSPVHPEPPDDRPAMPWPPY